MAEAKNPPPLANPGSGDASSYSSSEADERRTKIIKRASWVGIIFNSILAMLKITFGFLAHSYALIGDGIDSFTDVVTSGVTLVTASIAAQPPDKEHPYGHGRAETIATKLLSFIIFFAGAQLAVSAVKRIITPEELRLPEFPAFAVIIVSIVVKIFLSVYKKRAGKAAGSAMISADAQNMRNDVLISVSVLVGLLFTVLLEIPVIDSIAALLVSFWILKTALGIFLETSRELMDGVDNPELYRKVFEIVNSVPGTGNPHKTRIRKLNNVYIIDMDIEVDGSLTVKQGHAIAMAVEKAIKSAVPDVYDTQVHIEPVGNYEKREIYGLNENLIKNQE